MVDIPIFPIMRSGLAGLPVHKKPTFASIVATSVSGREVRSPQQAFPLWEFEVPFEILRDQTQNIDPDDPTSFGFHELEQMMGLFYVAAGQYGAFYYQDMTDYSRRAQLIGLGDGTTKVFTAVRSFGPISNEPVGGIARIFDLYLGGTVQSAGSYSFSGNKITFVTAPSASVAITIDFAFYYLCRFIEDTQDYEQFMRNMWTLKACKFRSTKP